MKDHLIAHLLAMFGIVCACHNTSRAWRGTHGRDYVRCLDCGKSYDSTIQFG